MRVSLLRQGLRYAKLVLTMDLKTYFQTANKTRSELAREVGITPVLISQWVHGARQVPAARCPSIERLTNGAVRCEDLRPDVDWAYLRGTAPTETDNQEAA